MSRQLWIFKESNSKSKSAFLFLLLFWGQCCASVFFQNCAYKASVMFSKQRETRTKFKLIDSLGKCDLIKGKLAFNFSRWFHYSRDRAQILSRVPFFPGSESSSLCTLWNRLQSQMSWSQSSACASWELFSSFFLCCSFLFQYGALLQYSRRSIKEFLSGVSAFDFYPICLFGTSSSGVAKCPNIFATLLLIISASFDIKMTHHEGRNHIYIFHINIQNLHYF